jgi:hypothetical protein
MRKKRHTRTPYKIHTIEGRIKKDIPMLMRFTKGNYMALIKGQEQFIKS